MEPRMTDVITINEEIEALGLFAATCDVMACDLTLTHREREMIENRATRYRALQLEAMAKLPAVIKSTAKSIISDMEAVGKERVSCSGQSSQS
jgi:putative N-acetylmannosamine-6-phosphate epimerase